MAEKVFFHSACCGKHWELVYYPSEDRYVIECETCGKPAGGFNIKKVFVFEVNPGVRKAEI